MTITKANLTKLQCFPALCSFVAELDNSELFVHRGTGCISQFAEPAQFWSVRVTVV